jgi:murein hydrolase activator
MSPFARGGIWLVSTLLSIYSMGSGAAPANEDRAEKHKVKLEKLRQQIDGLTESLEEERGKVDLVNDELRDLENKIGRIVFKVRIIEGNLKRQKQQLDILYKREKKQQDVLKEHQELLARQIRATYVMGRQERVKIILNQEDPAVLGRLLKYHDYLSEERSKRIKVYKEILGQLHRTRETIAAEEKRLNALKEKALARKTELEQVQRDRKSLAAQMQQRITDNDKELDQLRRNAEILKKLIVGLQNVITDISTQLAQRKAFDSLKGKLPWPTKGKMTADFGTSRKTDLKWDGVFISAAEGEEVKAIHHGRVAYADWLRGFGLLLIIDHGNGYMSLYGHNQSLFKEVGEWVEAGEPIAQVGVSGGQSKSGIYFGLRQKKKPLNPSRWCKPIKNRRVG